MPTKLLRLSGLLQLFLSARFVLSEMNLRAPGNSSCFAVGLKEKRKVVCDWHRPNQGIRLPSEDDFPLQLSLLRADGQQSPLLPPRAAQKRNTRGTEFNVTYNFIPERSDHNAIFRCKAVVQGITYEEKSFTIFITAGPVQPVLKGPSVLPLGETGFWTCTVDGATEAFPTVHFTMSKYQDFLDSCSSCIFTSKNMYINKTTQLLIYKVEAIMTTPATLALEWKEGEKFSVKCSSEYDRLPSSSRTRDSNELKVTIVGSVSQTTTLGRESKADTAGSSLLMWLTISTCIVVSILGAIAVVIIICRRRRLKNRQPLSVDLPSNAASGSANKPDGVANVYHPQTITTVGDLDGVSLTVSGWQSPYPSPAAPSALVSNRGQVPTAPPYSRRNTANSSARYGGRGAEVAETVRSEDSDDRRSADDDSVGSSVENASVGSSVENASVGSSVDGNSI